MIDHVRALLITLHLLVITVASLPAPRGMKRSNLEEPSIQAAIEPWYELATAVGMDFTPEEFREELYQLGMGLLHLRAAVLEPAQPYFRYCGARQGWAMFSHINHTPARLEIHVDRGQGWEPLYIARTDDYAWRRALFDQERFRA